MLSVSTGAAKGAADIILTEEGISTIITAIVNSRKIFRRLETYVIYRIACSLFISLFFFFAIVILNLEMPTWTIVILSLFNDLSAMALGLDKVPILDLLPICGCSCCSAHPTLIAAAP